MIIIYNVMLIMGL